MFSKLQIKKFEEIYREVTGIEISETEAMENGLKLVALHEITIKINNRLSGEKNGNLQTNKN
jgi:hypothetical protein